VNKETINMLEGNLYEINNTKWHNVKNESSDNRIHLIVDIMPNDYVENIRFE
jgi:aspartyl/asparaginyl beta-hydroxylase (cupin superfamily)